MSVLTQSERDGLDDVFLSIESRDNHLVLNNKVLGCLNSSLKYTHIFSSKISRYLRRKYR